MLYVFVRLLLCKYPRLGLQKQNVHIIREDGTGLVGSQRRNVALRTRTRTMNESRSRYLFPFLLLLQFQSQLCRGRVTFIQFEQDFASSFEMKRNCRRINLPRCDDERAGIILKAPSGIRRSFIDRGVCFLDFLLFSLGVCGWD